MTYAKVADNTIVEYNRTLPFSTETTSFGVGTTAEVLKPFGYLPIVGTEPEYDRATHKLGNVSYVIGANEVTKNYEVVEITADEILTQKKAEALIRIAELEKQALRPMRAIIANTATEYDTNKLAEIEAEITTLRGIL